MRLSNFFKDTERRGGGRISTPIVKSVPFSMHHAMALKDKIPAKIDFLQLKPKSERLFSTKV